MIGTSQQPRYVPRGKSCCTPVANSSPRCSRVPYSMTRHKSCGRARRTKGTTREKGNAGGFVSSLRGVFLPARSRLVLNASLKTLFCGRALSTATLGEQSNGKKNCACHICSCVCMVRAVVSARYDTTFGKEQDLPRVLLTDSLLCT